MDKTQQHIPYSPENNQIFGAGELKPLSRDEFEALVRRVARSLAPEIGRYLGNILLVARDKPARWMLEETETPNDDTLLGFYDGTSILDKSVMDIPQQPDTIYIFKQPLEEMCETIEELEEEIEVTLAHEIGHHAGISEERLAELGYE